MEPVSFSVNKHHPSVAVRTYDFTEIEIDPALTTGGLVLFRLFLHICTEQRKNPETWWFSVTLESSQEKSVNFLRLFLNISSLQLLVM